MKTKTLLITAAALAAGVLSSQAQVYSQNIVGYANVVIKGNSAFTLVANPLDDGNGNQLTNIVSALPNRSSVQVWNGAGFVSYSKVLGNWSGNPSLPPGVAFFVQNASTADVTNTFVGSIAVQSGQMTTNSIPANNFALVGSQIPYAGDLTDTNLNLGPSLPNRSSIQIWDNSGAGSFSSVSKVLGSWSANPTIQVGEGVFVQSPSATDWVQKAP